MLIRVKGQDFHVDATLGRILIAAQVAEEVKLHVEPLPYQRPGFKPAHKMENRFRDAKRRTVYRC